MIYSKQDILSHHQDGNKKPIFIPFISDKITSEKISPTSAVRKNYLYNLGFFDLPTNMRGFSRIEYVFNVLSYGLNAYGYDIRLSSEFRIFPLKGRIPFSPIELYNLLSCFIGNKIEEESARELFCYTGWGFGINLKLSDCGLGIPRTQATFANFLCKVNNGLVLPNNTNTGYWWFPDSYETFFEVIKMLDSAGYNGKLQEYFNQFYGEIYIPPHTTLEQVPLIDPKGDIGCNNAIKYVNSINEYFILLPHQTVLGRSYEEIHMPDNCLGICIGKSTYARCGVLINTTPLEPGWRGHLTIEITNLNSMPVLLYIGEGIAQIILFQGDYSESYNGRYQNSMGIVTAHV
jgi:deoxycytidine triphosphate deaminase